MAIEIQVFSPVQVLTNQEIASWGVMSGGKPLTEQSIVEKTGTNRRFIADETVLEMGLKAAQLLPLSPPPDMVIFSTSYPDGANNAFELVSQLNLLTDGCMNVHAACAGFTFSLNYIFENENRFSRKRILLIASEKYSPTLVDLRSDHDDSSLSQTIFSDGAVAMSFTEGEDMKILNSSNYSFPKERSACLRMPVEYGLVRHPVLTVDIPASENGHFWMDGKAVYEGIRETVPGLITTAIERAGLEMQQIKMVIPHQASRHMIDALAKRLPTLDFYRDLKDGNWSSASIPKAMARALGEGAVGKGDKLVLAGFGAGLFASIAVVQLN